MAQGVIGRNMGYKLGTAFAVFFFSAHLSFFSTAQAQESTHRDPRMASELSRPSSLRSGTARRHRTIPAPGIVFESLAFAVPTFFVTTAIHEGSHAFIVWMSGENVQDVRILPQQIDGHFVFGYTAWEGELTRTQTALTNIAPKLTDLAILGAYTAWLEGADGHSNQQVELVLAIVAAGAWVDFVHDIFTNDPFNDMTSFRENVGIDSPAERGLFYSIWVSLALAGGIEVGRGFRNVFRLGRRYAARIEGTRREAIPAPRRGSTFSVTPMSAFYSFRF